MGKTYRYEADEDVLERPNRKTRRDQLRAAVLDDLRDSADDGGLAVVAKVRLD